MVNEDVAVAILSALDAQRDIDIKIISILISITKTLPEEKKVPIAESILELIEEHKAGLEDMKNLHSALARGSTDGK